MVALCAGVVLRGVRWDRASAATSSADTAPICTELDCADGLLVGFVLVLGLLVSAKVLFFAAKQWAIRACALARGGAASERQSD